jgi:hypothetical protein
VLKDFLETLIEHDYSGRVVGKLTVNSGDVGVGNRTFPTCACLGVAASGVEYSCPDCGRGPGSYVWAQSGDGAGSYPIIEILSSKNQLVGTLVIFDSPLASASTIQSQIAAGAIPSFETFGLAKLKSFGDLKSLRLGEFFDVEEILVADVRNFQDQARNFSTISIKDSAVTVVAFCEPMSKTDLARPANDMISDAPDSPRPRVLAVLSSSLGELAPVRDEYVIENWASQVLVWRTSMITTEITIENKPTSESSVSSSGEASEASQKQAFCTQCGEQLLRPGQKFCQMCGAQAPNP